LLKTSIGYAQKTIEQNLQIDFLLGTSQNSGAVLGLAVKDVYNGFGLFYHTNGLGTAYMGESGIDYGSIADRTDVIDYGVIENNSYGLSFGLTYNLSKLLGKSNSGFTLFLGSGYNVKQEVSEKYEYYIWDCCPYLNDGNLITWISETKKTILFEFLLGYDFLKYENFKLNITSGYAAPNGLIGMIGIGFSL
jgi:hypothetical protein